MCIAMKFIGQSKLMVIPNFKGVCVGGIQYLWCPEVEKNQTPVKSSGDYHSLPLLPLEGGGIHSTVYLKKFFVKIFPPNRTFDLYVHLNVKPVLTKPHLFLGWPIRLHAQPSTGNAADSL